MKTFIALCLAFLLTSCAGLNTNFKDPKITVNDFKMLPLSGLTPEFEIGLNVKNNNDIPIILQGLDYTVYFNGEAVVSGVSTSLPTIAPRSDGDIRVKATPDFFGGFGVIKNLLKNRSDTIDYKIDVKLDVGAIAPKIPMVREGKFSLSSLKKMTNII